MPALADLKSELLNDPLGRGYAGMSAAAVADSLNAVNRPGPERASVRGAEIYNAIVQSEWATRTSAQQQIARDVFQQSEIDVRAGRNARAALLSVFDAASAAQTRAALAALVATQQSRANELSFGSIDAAHVRAARES